MHNHSMLILTAHDVQQLLQNCEHAILELVKQTYIMHQHGQSSVPQSIFLRFPNDQKNRIIALPAYIGGANEIAGIKWIASFPDNIGHGQDRASATILLNSPETGFPLAVMEGSVISARRTAASAALAAETLHQNTPTQVALVGCGVINFEILRFLQVVFANLASCIVYDLSATHAEQFRQRAIEHFPHLDVRVAKTLPHAFRDTSLVSFATTAGIPYLDDPNAFMPHSTILHISLRDLTPQVLLAADNVVDDIEHVCRAHTSVHLTAEQHNQRDFIRCTLADILDTTAPARINDDRPVIFSPFGLGVLDLAIAKYVYDQAQAQERGMLLLDFLPQPWHRHTS